MLVVLKPDSTQQDLQRLLESLGAMGASGHVCEGRLRTVEVLGAGRALDSQRLMRVPGVERVVTDPAALMAVVDEGGDTSTRLVAAGGAVIGGRRLAVIAGPCSV
ncbi:MAG: hypothetical protein HZB38_17755, partial [Planctomycetes bacterium]|nr:hypothetical protein [Planctomycetota bacterium]